MVAQTSVERSQRFVKWGIHCPICGGHAGVKQGIGERCAGFLSDDGEYAHCAREEFAGRLEANENTTPRTFCHKLYGPCNCGQEHNPAHTSSNGHTSQGKTKQANKPIEYSYHDASGRLAYQSLRYEPKTFKQRQPDGKGGWTWNMHSATYVPYRLLDLLKNYDAAVYDVEGEKDADNLARLGLVATTNVGGAGKWREEYNPYFKGRNVIILPDNDKAGRDHADVVTKALQGVAASVRIVNLPNLPDKGDVSDWLAAGGTLEQLEQMVKETSPTWEAPKRKFRYASEVQIEPVDWLWKKRIARGQGTLMIGDPGLGKGM